MKSLLFFITILCSWNIYAEEIFPVGCIPLLVSGDQAILSTEKPVVIMMHNLSNADLWITHPVNDAGAQAGWSSQLESGKWSALALDGKEKNFALQCIESRPGHEQQISCADVLAICQWPKTQMPENTSGTFWAGENMEMLPLKAYLERRGFILVRHDQN
ncbi:MAG: hypothetical protein Q8R83_09045 [Legionellaceae bacterium]|nr:hypothetical protein [Legionellaceae bacterium]